MDAELDDTEKSGKQLVELGFWPGGDRDGNPNVTWESTKKVASLLRTILFRCYYRDFRTVRRRITFQGVQEPLQKLQEIFYENSFNPKEDATDLTDEILANLHDAREVIVEQHNGLFVELVDDLMS